MYKKRMVEETYKICDYCGEEIDDYSCVGNGKDKHFHSMYAGGSKGVVKKTCLDHYNEQQEKEYRQKSKRSTT